MVLVYRRRAAAVMLAACAVIAAASGCATSSAPGAPGSGGTPGASGTPAPAVVARDSSNGHTLSLNVGERLELVLASDYWTVSGSSVPRVLRQDGPSSALKRPPACGPIPGLGCVPIRTDFSAVSPGTALITASRLSCGEALRCPPSRQHFTLTVVVR